MNAKRGNPGKRPPRGEAPRPETVSSADPPSHLTEAALEVWAETVPGLVRDGLLSVHERECMADYCEVTAELRELRAGFASGKYHNCTKASAGGGFQPSPESKRKSQLATLKQKLANDLGLTPAARRRMTGATKPPTDEDHDAFRNETPAVD